MGKTPRYLVRRHGYTNPMSFRCGVFLCPSVVPDLLLKKKGIK